MRRPLLLRRPPDEGFRWCGPEYCGRDCDRCETCDARPYRHAHTVPGQHPPFVPKEVKERP